MRQAGAAMTDREFDLHLWQIDATTAKLPAEAAKLIAGTQTETRWYVAVVASGATLAIVAVAMLFL